MRPAVSAIQSNYLQGFWEINNGGVVVNGKQVVSGNIDSFVDTGATLLIGDTTWALISSTGSIFVNDMTAGTCLRYMQAYPGPRTRPTRWGKGFSPIPAILFPRSSLSSVARDSLSARKVSISAKSLRAAQTAWEALLLMTKGSGFLVVRILQGSAPLCMAVDVVADVFLQNVYSSFDVGNKRVGFAPVKA